ncbi:MAG: protein kinase [Acidobacteriota bacterium]|nr:protein kinase [Acidobacteriota bacterium]
MKAERWRQIEELLDAALEREPAERGPLLDRACAGDADLRREVESLLVHETPSEDFIEAPAFVLAADLLADGAGEELENRRLGAYKILREIGRGGMGAVFLAERSDGEFQQKVALKLVRRGFATPDLTRRFRRERQILASLNHPNIARLLDGGVSTDGEPFLVMEYVEGVRIDAYCGEHNLSTGERLRLFLAVCRGVSYAHQHLVVHRDIKPSNILVTSEGVPKLLDFGIAKLLGAEHGDEHTQTTLHAFTPEYASPEQVLGASITTASDVYSLGVLLDELLHGARPSSGGRPAVGGWRSESGGRRKTVATNLPTNHEEARAGRKAAGRKSVSAELKNIIAMARREEPARRYASVAQFAEDVQRYLDGRPVRAQKDSFTYRAGKFVRRNKVGVAAVFLVALSLVVGLAAALWQANVARRERDRAERRFNDVRRLSNALLTDIAPKIERLQGSTEARQALVVQSLEYLNSLAQEAGGDLLLQSELASAYEKVGDLQGNPRKPNLGDFAGAIASYEKAQRVRRNLPDTTENQRLLAENVRGLADIRRFSYDIKGALQDYAGALKIYENLLTKNPESQDLQMAYLKTKLELAEVYGANNYQFDMAASLEREIVAALERLDPNRQEARLFLATAYSQLGHSLSWDNKQPEAETEMAKATALADELAAENPNDTNVQQTVYRVYMLAGMINENINNERSLQFLNKALRMVERAVELDAADVQAKQNLAKTYARLGMIYANLKRVSEAISALEKAEKISLEILEREPMNRGYQHDLAVVYSHFGHAKYEQRDWQGALKAFQKTADYFETFRQTDEKNLAGRRDLALALRYIGFTHVKLGDKKKAREHFQRALELLNQLKAQNSLGGWDQLTVDELQGILQSL